MSSFSDNLKCCTSPAQRSVNIRLFITAVIYLAAVRAVVRFTPVSHTSHVLISVITSVFLLAVIVLAGLYFKQEKDDFQRELLQRGMLWSIGATLAFTSIWGCPGDVFACPAFSSLLRLRYLLPLYCRLHHISAHLLQEQP